MNKQRQFYLVIPLLVIPFLTLAFWALGGGQGNPPATAAKEIDTTLPEAQFTKDQATDKLAVYQEMSRDSAQSGISNSFINALGLQDTASADRSAERIQAKLTELNRQLAAPQPPAYDLQDEATERKIRQLEQLARSAKTSGQEDPEMAQLSKMLSQIQELQNPVKIVQQPADNSPFKAIPAVIDGKQKVGDGSAVRLKLTDSISIKDQWIPKGQLLFGVCQVTNQRLLLTVQNVRLGQQIIPVSLTVFSLDGMPGIPAPEAELGGAAAGGADHALQTMQFLSMDQSLATQAAASGINAAKSLFSKKVKKIKVKLEDGYPILLKINKS